MQSALYLLLALRSLKKNYRIALPLFGGSAILVALFYSTMALPHSLTYHFGVDSLFAGAYFELIEMMCQFLLVIFFLYLNAIWNNTRAKENAIFTSLGMEKGQLVRITFYQLALFYVSSLVVGIVLGICLEKVLLLFLLKLLGLEPLVGLYVSFDALKTTALFILFCYGMLFVFSTISILRSKPLEHLHELQDGEKPLKAPYFFALLGLISLLCGYGIATTTREEMYLVINFFNAVLLVIIGTYLLFLYGSYILLELLCRNKKAYYQTRHFIFWSTMKAQLRKNALALANMSILSTMLLITSATTITLQMSIKPTIEKRFPNAFQVTIPTFNGVLNQTEQPTTEIQSIRNELNSFASAYDVEFQNLSILPFTIVSLPKQDNYSASVIALDDLNEMLHTNYKLNQNELYVLDGDTFSDEAAMLQGYDVISLEDDDRLYWIADLTPALTIVAPDDSDFKPIYNQLFLTFDLFDAKTKEKMPENEATGQLIFDLLEPYLRDQYAYVYSRSDFSENLKYAYTMLLVSGLYMTIIFLLAVILILYFKQITQGQEDRRRFKIMKHTGLEPEGLRQIINSQVRIMFFSPLITALIHILFAYPLIQQILDSMTYQALDHFFIILIACFMIFAFIYWITFRLTARSYYKLALLNDQNNTLTF